MKFFLTIGLLLTAYLAPCQTSFLKEAVNRLDQALLKKDTVTLKQLLHKDLSYGHSNGWVQNRQDVIMDLVNGKFSYQKIESRDQQWKAGKDWATVRSTTAVQYLLNGKEGTLNLHVLQVWIKTNKGWQLMARQSTLR